MNVQPTALIAEDEPLLREALRAQGVGVTVVDPRWVKPVDPALVQMAAEHRLVVSVEDNGIVGGVGAVLLQTLSDAGVRTPVRLHGIPQEFLAHAKRAVILERVGLSAQAVALDALHHVAAGSEVAGATGSDGTRPEGRALLDVDGPR